MRNSCHCRFFAPDFEKPIKNAYFEFDERSVKNYRVIDADQQKNQGSGSGGPASNGPITGGGTK